MNKNDAYNMGYNSQIQYQNSLSSKAVRRFVLGDRGLEFKGLIKEEDFDSYTNIRGYSLTTLSKEDRVTQEAREALVYIVDHMFLHESIEQAQFKYMNTNNTSKTI